MFKQLLTQLVSGRIKKKNTANTSKIEDLHKHAARALEQGDKHTAILYIQQLVELQPENANLLNDLGYCLADIGNAVEAERSFLRAIALDDTNVPAMFNRAKLLIEQGKGRDALDLLEQARIASPESAYIDSIYATYLFKVGDTKAAELYHLRAWLADFENLRLANAVLWSKAYDATSDEIQLPAEHLFWAETLPPSTYLTIPPSPTLAEKTEQYDSEKVRIGYWSPDFRNHSVSYFVWPLLKNQDTSKFSIYLLHDLSHKDEKTAIYTEQFGDKFIEVGHLPHTDLLQLIRELNLDILVELAGHTSHNRLPLLNERLAKIQITGIGYPATTGLKSVDYKVMDSKTHTNEAPQFYTEKPMVLPTSLWCFDPLRDVPPPESPPSLNSGHITFGCPGNINKISDDLILCWAEILKKVSRSVLRIQSVNFSEPNAKAFLLDRFERGGISPNRVELLPPTSDENFFLAYHEIDIVLDTFPFNGGTTTAFALYMGVPVVSRYGRSLLSRMGLSMLTNMSAADLAVASTQDYVARAVELAQDKMRLVNFRKTARTQFLSTALGDGAKFASEFEHACLRILNTTAAVSSNEYHQIQALPAKEIMRRAYTVRRFGQPEAVQRIVDHCLRHYPDTGSAHILWTDRLLAQPGGRKQAVAYLLERLAGFSPSDQVAAWAQIVRIDLLQNDMDAAQAHLAQWEWLDTPDPIDRAQARLLSLATDAARAILDSARARGTNEVGSVGAKITNVAVLIPCDDFALYELLKQRLLDACALPAGWTLQIYRCPEVQRLHSYRDWLANPAVDVLVLMQKNLHPAYPGLWQAVAQGLAHCDVVAMAGCAHWSRLDWRLAPYEDKAAGLLVPCGEEPDFLDWLVQGFGDEPLHTGMAVLDGHFLAIGRQALARTDFWDEASGAETLLEELWIYEAGQNGARLGVHKGLGLVLNTQIVLDQSNLASARWATAERYGFEPFVDAKDDSLYVAAPLASADVVSAALDAMNRQSVAESGIAQN